MTAYYFAARYSRNPELRQYRDELLAMVSDAEVTSRWIDQHGGSLEASYTPEVLAAQPGECWTFGAHDLEDLDAAATVVSFTGNGGGGKGGRHIEHGYAIAAGKRLVVVGPRENIFHCHPATEVYATWDDFLAAEATA
jgi:hypothetical protein